MKSFSTKDALLIVKKVHPAANANNVSDGLWIGNSATTTPVDKELLITIPPLPALTDNTKSITYKVQESDTADGSKTDTGFSFTITGVTTTGVTTATIKRYRPPSTAKAYQFLYQAVPASGGDHTGVTSEMALV